jgi:outer membrane receptor protein involved in Fe transport
MRLVRALSMVAAALVPAALSAQSLTGAVSGTVRDEQGAALPGAVLTLTGRAGSTTATAAADGAYRFPSVDPGTYSVKAEMAQFQAQQRDSLAVSVGLHLTVDFTLKLAGVEETLLVSGEAPVVDVTSSGAANTLSQGLLFQLPLSRRAQDILNYAPAINDDVGYGGGSGSNALYLDGLDTRSPSTGSQYVYVNYNIIEEVQVQGLGAPAEYGAFTGAIVNTVTRSGGNQFSGLFDVQYSTGSYASDNISSDIAAQNPSLAEPVITDKLLDITGQISGPIKKDELFFLVSAQRYQLTYDPAGPRTELDEVTPRLTAKLNWMPGPNDHLTLNFQGEDYNRKGLSNPRYVGALATTDELSRTEDSQDRLLNLQWRHLFGSSTFLEVKAVGWWAYDYLDPTVEAPIRCDGLTGECVGGGGYRAYFDRSRQQVNASVSHYAEAWGKHDFKFGVELERARVRDRLSYVGGFYYYDYGGPYWAYTYGYDQTGDSHRDSFYAQDSWRVNDRLTVNAGLRFDWVRGLSPDLDEKVFDTKSLAPRIGVAYDLTGNRDTVLKGFYGRYYEGAFQTYYYRLLPGLEDLVTYDITGGEPVEIDRVPRSELIYRLDPDIEHPRVDEFSVAVERALSSDVRLTLTGVIRDHKDFISSVNPSARWEPLTVENGLTGEPLTVYGWANPDESERDFLITNPDGFVFLDVDGNPIGTASASRKYRALMAVLSKRLSNRWQAQLSYVLSKNEGTVDPYSVEAVGYGRQFENPNLGLVNADGEFDYSRRHEVKLFASYRVPVVEVDLSGYYRWISGYPYTAYQRFTASEIPNLPASGREPWIEPRGSRRGENESILDLRLEKVFKIGGGDDRLGLYADITNVFNTAWINDVQQRFPSRDIEGSTVPFEGPTSVTPSRQLTLAARWSF